MRKAEVSLLILLLEACASGFYREHKLVGISLLGNLSEMEELKNR